MNKEKKEIIAIGDVHGRSNWRTVIEDNPGCKYVFLGDYCDPYEDVSHEDLIENLSAIIKFKKENPDNVVLLLGNHDMHYLSDVIPMGTRYDDELAPELKRIFSEDRELFQYAYQEGKTIFTHAGICEKWFFNKFKGTIDQDVASQLNNPTAEQFEAMGKVGYIRGGDSPQGGIFWADMFETVDDPLRGFHQVIGHTRVNRIANYSPYDGTLLTYCDCLENNIIYKVER